MERNPTQTTTEYDRGGDIRELECMIIRAILKKNHWFCSQWFLAVYQAASERGADGTQQYYTIGRIGGQA